MRAQRIFKALSLVSVSFVAACVGPAPTESDDLSPAPWDGDGDSDVGPELDPDVFGGPGDAEALPFSGVPANGLGQVPDVDPAPVVACDAACKALELLPYGGKFLGVGTYTTTFANTRVESAASYRFRAEHTGKISSFRVWLKTNENTDYDHKQYAYDDPDCGTPNSVAAEKCGYSKKYGGTVVYELRTDDGSANHAPSTTVLGSAKPLVDERALQENNFDHRFSSLKLQAPVSVEAGKIYHLVHRQTKLDRGAISINDAWQHAFDPDLPFGPFFGKDLGTLRLQNGSWVQRPGRAPIFEVHYDDNGDGTIDAIKGQTFAGGKYNLGDGEARIDGSKRARLKIVVPSRGAAGGSWKASSLWVLVARLDGQTDKPLTVVLKNSAGQVLGGTKKVPASSLTQSATGFRDEASETFSVKWNKVTLDSPQTLTVGSTYYVELSAPTGAKLTAPFNEDMTVAWPFNESKAIGNKAAEKLTAQVSTNGGSSWAYGDAGSGGKRSVVMPVMVQMAP